MDSGQRDIEGSFIMNVVGCGVGRSWMVAMARCCMLTPTEAHLTEDTGRGRMIRRNSQKGQRIEQPARVRQTELCCPSNCGQNPKVSISGRGVAVGMRS